MNNKFCYLIFLLIFTLFNCKTSNEILIRNLQNSNIKEPFHNENILNSINEIAKSGGNIKRYKKVRELADSCGLKDNLKVEWIDWYGFQKNILIEIKGETDTIIYITAHYDKTGTSLLKNVSVLLNGSLDPLISWMYLSKGAVDNATGVAISLELAKMLSKKINKYTYRFLLTASEENGLRGSRTHVAILQDSIYEKIRFVINIDCVGVIGKDNAITSNVSSPDLIMRTKKCAEKLNFPIKMDSIKFGTGDFLPFKGHNFGSDFILSLKYNLIGAFLPQRSYFGSSKKGISVINFTCSDLINYKDFLNSTFYIPVGNIHSPNDNLSKIDIKKIDEQFLILRDLINDIERN